MTDEQIGPEDVAAAIRARQAPSEVVDDAGAPAAADGDSDREGDGDGATGSGSGRAAREETAP